VSTGIVTVTTTNKQTNKRRKICDFERKFFWENEKKEKSAVFSYFCVMEDSNGGRGRDRNATRKISFQYIYKKHPWIVRTLTYI